MAPVRSLGQPRRPRASRPLNSRRVLGWVLRAPRRHPAPAAPAVRVAAQTMGTAAQAVGTAAQAVITSVQAVATG